MRRCFGCLRHLKFMFRAKIENKKWLTYIENYCSQNSRDQWCQLIVQNYPSIKTYDNPSQEIFRQLKSTNISTQIIRVIRKHYRENSNLFSFICDVLSSYVKQKYSDVINPSQSTISKLSKDYEKFIDFIRNLIVVFYQLQERQLIGEDQFYKITLTNFIAQCLFGKEEFNTCIIQVLKSNCKDAQERINFNIQKFSSLSIKDYEVSPKFSLDERTLNYFDVENQKISTKPYSGAIQMIKQIVRVRTPHEKLKNLENLIRQLEFCLNKFYQTHKIKDSITMDADNAISILLYILVQAGQSQFLSHILCIQNFIGKDILGGGSGYCLATVKACLQFLQKGNIKRSNKGLNIPENQFSLWINVHNYFEHVTNSQL